MNTQNIYLAFVRQYNKRKKSKRRRRRKNDSMQEWQSSIVFFLPFFLLHTRARFDNIFFDCWLVRCRCVYVNRKNTFTCQSTHTYMREMMGLAVTIIFFFFFSLVLPLPIVNRSLFFFSLSLFLSLSFSLLKWRQTNGNEQQTVNVTLSEIAKQISRLWRWEKRESERETQRKRFS